MKVKPKEVMVNLPTVLTFTHEGEDAALAAGFNAFLHGKVRLKYETLGELGGQHVAIFYLQRNNEFQQLRDSFMEAINQEEQTNHISKGNQNPVEETRDSSHDFDDDPEMWPWVFPGNNRSSGY